MPKFIIHHVTRYTYPEPVRDSANQIMLFPIKDEFQFVQSQKLQITGEPPVEAYRDYYNNEVGTFMNIAPHTELRIDSTIAVTTMPRQFPADDASPATQWDQLDGLKNMTPFIDFLKQETFSGLEEVRAVCDEEKFQQLSVFETVQQLTAYVYKEFNYIQGVTTVESTPDEIWRLKAGVCQDFAHILLVMLRLLYIPARYVSGYVCPHLHDLRGEGATHAWVEAYIPFYGWLGLDPTNNCLVNDLHVRLAIGRNFTDCSPVKGTYKGTAKQTLEVGVSVSHEDAVIARQNAEIHTPAVKTVSITNDEANGNSFRRYMQMMQQQQ